MKALAIDDDRAWTATRLAPVIWLAVTTAAIWASEAALVPAVVMAAAGIATSVLWPELRPALLTPLVPAAFGGLELLPWGIAGVALCWPHRTVLRTDSGLNELQRHVMRLRRREEEATVLMAVGPRVAQRPLQQMLESLRATDSVEVTTRAREFELCALLDGVDFTPAVIEERIAEAGELHSVTFGWARFPRDGVTLAVLRERALAAALATGTDGAAAGEAAAEPSRPDQTESEVVQAKI